MPLNTLMGENRILGAGAGTGLAVEDLSPPNKINDVLGEPLP